MEISNCLQCGEDFPLHGENDKRIFCSTTCRHRAWNKKFGKSRTKIDTGAQLEDLRYEMHDAINQIKGLHKSLDRIENEYQDWEDRVNAIEKKLCELEKEVEIEDVQTSNQLAQNAPATEFNVFDEMVESE